MPVAAAMAKVFLTVQRIGGEQDAPQAKLLDQRLRRRDLVAVRDLLVGQDEGGVAGEGAEQVGRFAVAQVFDAAPPPHSWLRHLTSGRYLRGGDDDDRDDGRRLTGAVRGAGRAPQDDEVRPPQVLGDPLGREVGGEVPAPALRGLPRASKRSA